MKPLLAWRQPSISKFSKSSAKEWRLRTQSNPLPYLQVIGIEVVILERAEVYSAECALNCVAIPDAEIARLWDGGREEA